MDEKIKEFKEFLDCRVVLAENESDYDPFDWSAAIKTAELRSIQAKFIQTFMED